MSTALDMTSLIQIATLGTAGTDLFVNEMPDFDPDGVPLCTACFDLPSLPVLYAHGMSEVNQRRRVQIQVRSTDAEDAHVRCQAVIDALAGQFGVTVNSRVYEEIRALGSAALLAREEKTGTVLFYGEVEAVLDLG